MKKTFLTIVCCLWVTLCTAQISYHQGDKVNKKAYAPGFIHLVPAADGTHLISVEPNMKAVYLREIYNGAGQVVKKANNGVKGIKVRIVDSEWNESASVDIEDTKGYLVCAAFRNDNILHVILGNDEDEDDQVLIRHITLNAQTLAILSDQKLVDVQCEKKEKSYYLTAQSPDEQHFGLIYTVYNKKEKTVQTIAQLYDRDMNRLWEQELYYGAIDQMLVSNQGTISTACLVDNEEANGETVFLLNATDGLKSQHGEFTVPHDIEQVALLNHNGSRILTSTLEGKLGHSILTERKYTGIHAYLFDLESQQLVYDTAYQFTSDDIHIFDNTTIDLIVHSKTSEFLMLRDRVTTPDGGAVLYQKSWKSVTRDVKTGMSSNESIHNMGMLLANIDTTGHIKWIRGIRQDNQNGGLTPPVNCDLFRHGDNLYVITNESKGDSDTYDPSRPAHRGIKLLKANAALAIYYFTPDGVGAKQMLQRDGTHILLSTILCGANGKYHFLTGALRPKISSITIP